MFIKKILIDLDGVLNEYGKEKLKKNREASRAKIDPLFQQIRQKEQAKPKLLFRLNLAYNEWFELGHLRMKQKLK